MTDSNSESSSCLTDNKDQLLQDAQDTIHELQHELERLQLDFQQQQQQQEKGADNNNGSSSLPSSAGDEINDDNTTMIQSLRLEISTLKEDHAAQVKDLQNQIAVLELQHEIAIEKLQLEQQQQILYHQENMEELGNLLRYRQQEQLDTLQDFTSKLTQVGAIHQEAIQMMEAKHQRELDEQRSTLLAE